MSVVVMGCGRSGTNMALEILSGNSFFKPTNPPWDACLFTKKTAYPDNYLTKTDTCNIDFNQIKELMTRNCNMKLIWTIRDPRDIVMSKIRRGMPKSEGGDCDIKMADDATPQGCIKDIFHMQSLYVEVISCFSDRVLLVKMEDMILNTRRTCLQMCSFLGITFQEEMIGFYKRMRVEQKRKRYHEIDAGEIAKYQTWQKAYDGFFVKNNYNLESLFVKVSPLVDFFRYQR